MDKKIKVYQKVKAFLDKQGSSFYKLSQETGISTATFSEWGKGTYMPKTDKLILIANYMGMSVEELLE